MENARREQGLTVRDVGILLDEPFQIVTKIETCQRKLNVYEFVQYCSALKLNPKEGIDLLMYNSDFDTRLHK
ncbi:transcriptional regulator, XRE family [Shewanella sediminis HAW-EB3]|uniref:Transcriptional regulator, XRE family n=1 Tax=Shewanella sediminis (strain HAW-EB3) TaxID=425104 RepID=A8FW49_SHESH|nr:transcriptional regulator, XRE family [Shewanella sediminis HAW-EB3]